MPDARPTSSFSRRGFLGLTGAAALAATLAACSGGGSPRPQRTRRALRLPTHVPPPEVPGGLVGRVDGMPTLYTGPVPDYVRSVAAPPMDGGRVTTFQVLWGAPPQDQPENAYWAELEERLGGTYDPTLVAFDTYNEKLATTIASGDVPDLVFVQDTVAVGAKAISDGVFADLSDVLAGDGVLRWPNLAHVGPDAWTASAKDGHLFGVPNENPPITNFPTIRWDLMEAVGHPVLPESAEGFLEMMAEIAALGSHDGRRHWGIAAFDDQIQSVVEWMHRAGTEWQLDDAGDLVHLIETDGYADVLGYHRRLWEAGVYHPDALALASQGNRAKDLWGNGQVAILMDSFNGYFGAAMLRNLVDGVPGADPRLFVPPAVGGADPLIQRDDGYWGMVAISARAAEDPDRLAELLGVLDYWRAPEGSSEALFVHTGVEGVNFELGPDNEIVDLGDETADADRAALQWLGVFKSPGYVVPENALEFVDNFREVAEALTVLTVPSPVVGLHNEARVTHGARLSALDADYRGGIVSGRMSLGQLDEYRDAWRRAGGDDVRRDYQAALEAGR